MIENGKMKNDQKNRNEAGKLQGTITQEAVMAGLKQLASLNNVFVTFLETTSAKEHESSTGEKLSYMAVFAEPDALIHGQEGKESIKKYLHRAVAVPRGQVYCPCRMACISAKEGEELLKLYAEAGRAIRETASIRELFRAEGYPIPEYLSEKTAAALCHFREKLSDRTLGKDVRERYALCIRRLVQEAGQREPKAGR
ncbi:MAG: hypothetical protein IJT16_13490 [Lachnospiraceae bacterium]|nr:hypothetical protein [Lachnospiraceae bacterium]